jgi:hypothetical protein
MKKSIVVVAIVVTIATIVCGYVIASLSDECGRLRANQRALLTDVELYRTRANESAASVEVLQLSVSEFRELRAKDAKHIEDLGIRLRRAESYAKSASTSTYEERLPLRDTIILRDTVRIFEGGDEWSRVQGSVTADSIAYLLHSVDTLYQVVHRVPYRWWIFRWGTKAIRQEIRSSNPHTRLTYAEYIQIES